MVLYTCEICDHKFKQKSHYTNHKNRKIPCSKSSTIEEIKNENKKIKKELKESIEIIEKLKNIKDININGENNGNININNCTINNNINVIQIIEHGKEDYSKIDIEKIMLENPVLPNLNYISTVIYHVHCSEKYPEYQNIYISDMNRNKAIAYQDGKWTSKDKSNTIETLFNNITNCVDTVTENAAEPNKFINYSNEIKKVNPFGKLYNKKNRKAAICNSENILYDNKDKIKTKKIKNTNKKQEIEI